MESPAAQYHVARQVGPLRDVPLAAVFIEFIANLEADGAAQLLALQQGQHSLVEEDELAEEPGQLIGGRVKLAGVGAVAVGKALPERAVDVINENVEQSSS